jgi:hypothetical protein
LTDQARLIEQKLEAVRQDAIKILLAQGMTETLPPGAAGTTPGGAGTVPPGEPGSRRDRYMQLLTEYHDALAAYIQHRKDVAAHAQQYHQQAQDQQALNTPIDVPTPKLLKLRAQDACYQLQARERMLVVDEMQMRDLLNALVTERGQLAPQAFMNQWLSGQSRAMSLMQGAHDFEDGVIQKQALSSNELHDQVHLAFDSGDFVGSQKVYDEVERRHALIQEEVQRAGSHMSLAREFILKLGLLNPQAPAAGGSSDSGDSSNGSFANADAELDREYQHVQQLYAELQSSRPTR